jgi:glycerol 2-dehydrogenase (NADP+)
MQKLPRDKVRNIGVANFDIHNLEILLGDPSCKTIPAVNQIELHPYNPSPKLVRYCKDNGIQCIGFSPLGSKQSPLSEDTTILAIAEKKGKTAQQVLLMWGLQNGWGVIPSSVHKDRINSNFELDGWSLTDDELYQISGIKKRMRVYDEFHKMRLPCRVFFDDNKVSIALPWPMSTRNSVLVKYVRARQDWGADMKRRYNVEALLDGPII